eukprot:scaffold78700_cov32-Tisochrysis_lutea.AAC.1
MERMKILNGGRLRGHQSREFPGRLHWPEGLILQKNQSHADVAMSSPVFFCHSGTLGGTNPRYGPLPYPVAPADAYRTARPNARPLIRLGSRRPGIASS